MDREAGTAVCNCAAEASHRANLEQLETLVGETFALWSEVWVGFSWRAYYLNHTRRVRALCGRMAAAEEADPLVLDYASLLHDITKRYDGGILKDGSGKRVVDANGFWRTERLLPKDENRVTRLYERLNLHGMVHSVSGSRVVRALLREMGVCDELVRQVAVVIRDHVRPSDHGDPGGTRRPVESEVLHDADMLDANLGLVAFYRNIQIHTQRTAEDSAGGDPLLRYLRYLPSWIEMKEPFIPRMATRSGRRLALARQQRVQRVYAELREELQAISRTRANGLSGILDFFMSTNSDPDLERDRAFLERSWLPSRTATEAAKRFCTQLAREIAGLL